MSGLANYFRNYLNCNEGDENKAATYEASLLQPLQEQQSIGSVQANDTAANHALHNLQRESIAAYNKLPEYTSEMLDYKGWRKTSQEYCLMFLKERIRVDNEGDEADNAATTSQEIVDHDLDDKESQQNMELESQALEFATATADNAPPPAPPASASIAAQQQERAVPFERRIPRHLRDTIHEINYLSDLNLYTKEMTRISLCRAAPYWMLRDVKRPALLRMKRQPPRKYAIYDSSSLKRLEPCGGGCDSDGPLASLYAQVLCLEVIQLDRPSELRMHVPMALHPSTATTTTIPSKRRTKVYFYNQYAQVVNKLLLKKGINKVTYMSFRRIPAMCVLPWSFTDWFDRHGWNECCLCIGDTSAARVPEAHNDVIEKRYIRFDNKELELRIGWIADNAAMEEYSIRAGESEVLVDKVVDTGSIDSLSFEYLRCSRKEPKDFEADKQGGDNKKKRLGTNAPQPQQKRHSNPETASHNHGAQSTSEASTAPATPSRPLTSPNRPINSADRRVRAIVYDRLNDLLQKLETRAALGEEGGCIVSIFTSVLGFRSPFRTKKGDQMMSIQLVDDSLPLEDDVEGPDRPIRSVQFNLFTKRIEDLPHLRYAGDVLRMHRIKAQLYKGELQLLGMRESSYVVFRHDPATDAWLTLPTAHIEYQLTVEDLDRVTELWHWSQKRLLEHPTMKAEHALTIEEMKPQGDQDRALFHDEAASGDLTVMVTAVIPSPLQSDDNIRGTVPFGYLRVWDGTGFPGRDPLPPDIVDPGVSKALVYEPSNSLLNKIKDVYCKYKLVNPAFTAQPPVTTTGKIVNIVIWEQAHWELVQDVVSPGSFIRLRNIQDSILHEHSLRCLMVYKKSFLTPLPDMTFEVIRLLAAHGARLRRGDPVNTGSGTLSFRPKGLQHLLTGPVGTIFRGSVRVVDTLPPLNYINMTTVKQFFTRDGSGDALYRLAVSIADEHSTTITALLTEAAATSLIGMSPSVAFAESAKLLTCLRTMADERNLWDVTIRSVVVHGKKYFIVTSLFLKG
ncbi:hypothetical protein MPSEU_000195000 [Mayamaea pseudoterrestris]|nr:hypothetical protein MPSEU_000195000 [Mayamaea pseudoterrestris]